MYIIQTIFLLSSFFIPSTENTQKENKASNQPVVFLAGIDEEDNPYYAQAEKYFIEQDYKVIKGKHSLKEIVDWLNKQSLKTLPKEVHIVSHSNPWRGLSMKTTPDGERITIDHLASSQDQIPNLKPTISNDLKIIFHACGLGENKALLRAIKQSIDKQNVIELYASPYFSIFGSPFAPHYLAEYFYVFYPTANSPGRIQLAKELAASYQTKSLNWRKALETKGEKKLGMPYRYRFNIPLVWEVEYEMEEYLPILQSEEAIMDWVAGQEDLAAQLLQLNIPIEKFRWQREIVENKLIIKGKTTVQCILKPITESENNIEYILPRYWETGLYVKV